MAKKQLDGRLLILCTVLCACLSMLLVAILITYASGDATANTEAKVGQGQLIAILELPSIQKELGLNDEQIAALAKINKMQPAATFEEAIAPLNAILDGDQLTEFKKIALQGLMLRAFTVAEVQDSLELTADQKEAIASIQSRLKMKLQPSQDKINKRESLDLVKLDSDNSDLYEDAYVEALNLLTPDQRKKLETIARPVPLRHNRG